MTKEKRDGRFERIHVQNLGTSHSGRRGQRKFTLQSVKELPPSFVPTERVDWYFGSRVTSNRPIDLACYLYCWDG